MPTQYSKETRKSGASIGTITAVWKPSTWVSATDDWTIEQNFPGWLECNGATLDPNEYYALYQIIGTNYGGTVTGNYPNFSGTFNLPDYRGRVLCGTGSVDGNRANSATLTPNILPTGVAGNTDVNVAGASGGTYVLSTVRQLPPDSEITPGGSDPGVYYDVSDTFLTSRETLNGTARIPYGTGITEVGGFSEPLITNGGNYLAFGTPGLSPFNTPILNREATYSNLDFTNYNQLIIYVIAGNDNNGGERVNNSGEGLRVIWSDGTEDLLLPAVGDTSLSIPEWDPLYTTWVELVVEIPEAVRLSNETIILRQNWDGDQERVSSGTITTDPNSNDCIGVQRIGFRLVGLGGTADDTFVLGTFRTSGFSETVRQNITGNFAGNIEFDVGPLNPSGIFGAPPHSHELQHCTTTSEKVASTADGGPEENDKSPILSDTNGTIIEYRRRIENPGAGSSPTLRKHTHKLTKSTGVTITFGNDEGGGNDGAKIPSIVGGSYSNDVPADLDDIVSSTYDVVQDGGMELIPGVLTMSDSSRTLFDSRIDARLEAAEEIPVLQPYFRTKYIIKAY